MTTVTVFKPDGPPPRILSNCTEGIHPPVLVCHPDGTWERCDLKRRGEIAHKYAEEIMSGPPRRSAHMSPPGEK